MYRVHLNASCSGSSCEVAQLKPGGGGAGGQRAVGAGPGSSRAGEPVGPSSLLVSLSASLFFGFLSRSKKNEGDSNDNQQEGVFSGIPPCGTEVSGTRPTRGPGATGQ